jgi:hypothetical protein
MSAILWSWGISAAAMVVLAVALGYAAVPGRGVFGVLVDRRGRFSLTHFQLVVWTIVVLSLISGIFWGRLIKGVDDPLSFSIPDEVLGLMGITLGSSVAAGVVKSSKDATAGERIAASNPADRPRLAQMFLVEEGLYADKIIDIAKFQNFVITLVLVVAYVALSVDTITDAKTAAGVEGLPSFSGTFLTLLGISHATYVAGKLPTQQGIPPGLTVENRPSDPTSMPEDIAARNPTPT